MLTCINTWTILMRNSTWLSQRCQVTYIEKRAIYVSTPELRSPPASALLVGFGFAERCFFAIMYVWNYLCTYRLNRMVRWIRWHCPGDLRQTLQVSVTDMYLCLFSHGYTDHLVIDGSNSYFATHLGLHPGDRLLHFHYLNWFPLIRPLKQCIN